MKNLLALCFIIALTFGLASEASGHNKYYKDEVHALKVHQKADRDRLLERQKRERENLRSAGGDVRTLRERQKAERDKLKIHQKAEREQIKYD